MSRGVMMTLTDGFWLFKLFLCNLCSKPQLLCLVTGLEVDLRYADCEKHSEGSGEEKNLILMLVSLCWIRFFYLAMLIIEIREVYIGILDL